MHIKCMTCLFFTCLFLFFFGRNFIFFDENSLNRSCLIPENPGVASQQKESEEEKEEGCSTSSKRNQWKSKQYKHGKN